MAVATDFSVRATNPPAVRSSRGAGRSASVGERQILCGVRQAVKQKADKPSSVGDSSKAIQYRGRWLDPLV